MPRRVRVACAGTLALCAVRASAALTFSAGVELPYDKGIFPTSVVTADIDGDKDLDVIATFKDSNEVIWWENTDGRGAFSPGRQVTGAARGAHAVWTADLDRDGDEDVVCGNVKDHRVTWFENADGRGAFSEGEDLAADVKATHAVWVGDLNGDGDPDVLSSSPITGRVTWWANDDAAARGGGLRFGEGRDVTDQARGAFTVLGADLDGDGLTDILTVVQKDDSVVWLRNLGGGEFSPELAEIAHGDRGIRSLAAADVDGDGRADVVAAAVVDHKVLWYRNRGDGSFEPGRVVAEGAMGARAVVTADLDDDGDPDVLVGSMLDNRLAWSENRGGGEFAFPRDIATDAADAHAVWAADIDGDGRTDVLVAAPDGKRSRVVWYRNLGEQGGEGAGIEVRDGGLRRGRR